MKIIPKKKKGKKTKWLSEEALQIAEERRKAKTRLGVVSGSDKQLLIAKFRLKLK